MADARSTDHHGRLADANVQAANPGIALLPLVIAIVLALLLTIYPPILTTPQGRADHAAATLALWAMSTGFIRGVGFVPKHVVPRVLFSTAACLLCLALSVVLVARHGIAF